ncbi:phospholipid-transporting ATPase VD isoform X2 [Astatotilapia calliptera]|uniref:phospholipid-transporting ATPase VD isoform X2 n=1 Tax=Astatotilapia calliptera TaxID=8154 RepID=UPI000E414E64|nr:probable phospholipid-transporting ATPase VD isoform X2 [Astatotilapia calliptera]
MERLRWVQQCCRQLLAGDSRRGWYSDGLPNSSLLDTHSPRGRVCGKQRTVFPRNGRHQQDYERVSRNYKSNAISTTKYTFLTFIPMNLFEQFHRAANLYFLFLTLLNWVPVVEAFQKEITMIPLLVVLIIIAIKDALEDFRRYLFDKKVNNNVVRVFCGTQQSYVDQCWKNVQVGDFVHLSCNEIIPADMLLLYSSDPHGVCYIETANLDGETNLKQRQVVSDFPLQGEEFTPESFHSRIECENPNNDLSRFRGYMEHSNGVRVGLHSGNLLLRSCTIRNTETVVGIVVYAGHETKAMMNNSGPRYKRSKLEKHLNTDILWCVVLLFVMCLTAAIGHGLWMNSFKESIFQVDTETPPALAGFYIFWTMVIVLQAKEVVPDPALGRKLNWLTNHSSSETPSSMELTYITDFFLALAICNSVVVSSPNQPRHVIPEERTPLKSLEEVKLMFQRFSFSPFSALSPSQIKGSPHSLKSRLFIRGKRGSLTLSTPVSNTTDVSGSSQENDSKPDLSAREEEEQDVEDQETEDDLKDTQTNPDEARQSMQDLTKQVEEITDELVYEAESPDEAALVHAARAYRCTLRGRSAESLLVDLPGIGSLAIQLLHILPFDSNRKRMSVVVRHPLTGQVVVFTKGADSVIMDLAESPTDQTEVYSHIKEKTQKHLDAYAREGLRTLCIAKKVLKEDEYDLWLKAHMLAESSIENREELLLESAQRLETNLTLLGTTGIVDRLQEEVPETIAALQRAGIKVWVLTGDKQETAINIAYACKLLCASDKLLTANCGSKDACAALFEDLILEVQGGESLTALTGNGESMSSSFILVTDGRTLGWALEDELRSNFLELSRRCKAVICCRSTPLQKSQVVQLIRDHLGVMTLAVGDGANDVSMIQVADVGIGISGQEGMQAVMSSDFAISRFKHLSKLLLVHGHWCYSRLANMIQYFIYKNVMYVNLLFWYQFFCGFSGSVMTNSWVLILFNLIFTSAPPLIYGILNQDLPADTLMELPELYQDAQTSKTFVPYMFWITVLDAFYQSLVCFFVPYFAYAGSDVGVLSFGSPINASALFIILLHQVIESNTLTWIHMVVLVLSCTSYFGFVLLLSGFCVTCSPPVNPLGIELLQMSHSLFYITCVLTTVAALLPRLFFQALCNTLHPSTVLKSAHMDTVDSENYRRRMQRWNMAHSKTNRLSAGADNAGLEPSLA